MNATARNLWVYRGKLFLATFMAVLVTLLTSCTDEEWAELEAEFRTAARTYAEEQVHNIVDDMRDGVQGAIDEVQCTVGDTIQAVVDWFSSRSDEDVLQISPVTREEETANDLRMQREVFALFNEARFSGWLWLIKDESEKKGTLNQFLEEVQAIMGTTANSNIAFFSGQANIMGTYWGRFIPATNQIYLNENIFSCWLRDDYRLFRTLIHEVRHAYQHETISDPLRHMVSDETREHWERNMRNYIRGGNAYFVQPVEWDAFNFSRTLPSSVRVVVSVRLSPQPKYRGSW